MSALCDTLEVGVAGYCAWLSETQSLQEQRDRELMPLVGNIFWQHKRRYGPRRIAYELNVLGHVERFAKLLKLR
ncbi:hypothetical protein NA78x_003356 [Anatilimnocola sp. NA78]|uniref:hypothetical protein n=1 Tax=Anatilimnocola sp. NA78 TaxID=3415683 RepID=UPI003CE4D3CC